MTKRNSEQWRELVGRVAKDQYSEELRELTNQIAATLRENDELEKSSRNDAQEACMANEQISPSGNYADLQATEGIRFESCVLAKRVLCPFCSSDEAALLAGDINLTAQISNENVAEEVTLAGFIRPESHVFFLRERDVITMPNPFENVA